MTISERLSELKKSGEGALAMFATAGDPGGPESIEVFRAIGGSGADIIEIGVPYSDPLMDGPTLQLSYKRALDAGFKLKNFPAYIEAVRAASGIPALIMTCFNPVHKYGVERFFRDVSSAGADSVLLTDLPPEEWGEYAAVAESCRLGAIFLVTPTTTPERMRMLGARSNPFVYCVSKVGITGASEDLPETLVEYLQTVRENISERPLMVGFGVSQPSHAALLKKVSDGVIVGSALVKLVEKNVGDAASMAREVAALTSGLKEALRG